VVCDHAGVAVPRALRRLGLPDEAFETHSAWDIGALGLARRLGGALGACVISQAYSRLVIDCNRALGHPQSIVHIADGFEVPANRDLSPEEAAARAEAIHRPYHDAIAAELEARRTRGLATVMICQHSFTPVLGHEVRPWHYGILHLGDSPVSTAMLQLLGEEPGLVVGDNQPYAMDEIDFTAPRHASPPVVEAVEIEVRQDLISDAPGRARAADLLARLLPLAVQRARVT
jgi:predicted N-formylglutamate amidohydrolase